MGNYESLQTVQAMGYDKLSFRCLEAFKQVIS